MPFAVRILSWLRQHFEAEPHFTEPVDDPRHGQRCFAVPGSVMEQNDGDPLGFDLG